MKKILLASLLALGVLSLSQQQASAWVNAKFGVGLNFAWQSGGNCFLWGLAKGEPHPGSAYAPGSSHDVPYAFEPIFYQPDNSAFYGAHVGAMHDFAAPAPTPVSTAPRQDTTQRNARPGSQPQYQTVTYPNYPMPNYNYPATNYYGR
jgi:hypothetical protein